MAYPSVHKLTVVHISAHSPSIGASPVAAYLRVPFRCSIEKLAVVAAGEIASMTPTAKTYANEDDTISFTPSGASGANIPATFTAVLKQA